MVPVEGPKCYKASASSRNVHRCTHRDSARGRANLRVAPYRAVMARTACKDVMAAMAGACRQWKGG